MTIVTRSIKSGNCPADADPGRDLQISRLRDAVALLRAVPKPGEVETRTAIDIP